MEIINRRVELMKRRRHWARRQELAAPERLYLEDAEAVRSEAAWLARVADARLPTQLARRMMAVFDDDLIEREMGRYDLPWGMPGPEPGGWRGAEDFVSLGTTRIPARALLTLQRLVYGGYLEELVGSVPPLFRPA